MKDVSFFFLFISYDSCRYSKDVLYFGEDCRRSINKLGVYIGLGIATLFIIILVAVLSVCLVKKKTESKETDEGKEADR